MKRYCLKNMISHIKPRMHYIHATPRSRYSLQPRYNPVQPHTNIPAQRANVTRWRCNIHTSDKTNDTNRKITADNVLFVQKHIKRECPWEPREITKMWHMLANLISLIFRLEIPHDELINVVYLFCSDLRFFPQKICKNCTSNFGAFFQDTFFQCGRAPNHLRLMSWLVEMFFFSRI